MVTFAKLKRSFSSEPGQQYINDLRVIPFSESPWVSDLAPEDAERLERIAPSSPPNPRKVFATATPQHSHTRSMSSSYTDKPLVSPPLGTPYSYSQFGEPYLGDGRQSQPGTPGFVPPVPYNPTEAPLIQHSYPPIYAKPEVPAFPTPAHMDAVQIREDRDARADLEENNGPPEWLGIFFDLAWTTTFSNLTNSTQLTTIDTLGSYTVFFGLAWWLWAAQVTYDVKYFTNDWWHRVMLLLQLVIFASLSAFTKDFNPFSTELDAHKVEVEEFPRVEYARKCNLGISALFACARVLLIISYLRVIIYLPKTPAGQRQRYKLWLTVGSYTLSCTLFIMAFCVVKFSFEPGSVWGKLILWLFGILVEVGVHVWGQAVDGRLLINIDTMGERVSTLTTIILGEGLNSLAQTLILCASAIGFSPKIGAVAFSIGVMLTFAFLLYFDGFKRKTLSMRNRSKMNVLLHFPVHLSIIVLLESMKNALVLFSIQQQSNYFFDKLNDPEVDLVKTFRNVGINVNKVLEDGRKTQQLANGGQQESPEDLQEIIHMMIAQAVLNIYENFDLADDDFKNEFTKYITKFNGTARNDGTDGFALTGLIDGVINAQQESSIWIPLAAGAFVLSLALIALVNNWVPKHRYIWAASLSRALMAIILFVVAFLKVSPTIWNYLRDNALLPAVVGTSFVVQFAIDQILIAVAVRRHTLWTRVATGMGLGRTQHQQIPSMSQGQYSR